ncbi:hypothetical protein GCM10027416_00790 [Okibacterium endophyticum]
MRPQSRIQVVYGGVEYSIGNRSAGDVRDEISDALQSGEPYWLSVNHGEGRMNECSLLLTRGVSISVLEIEHREPNPAEPYESKDTPGSLDEPELASP